VKPCIFDVILNFFRTTTAREDTDDVFSHSCFLAAHLAVLYPGVALLGEPYNWRYLLLSKHG